MTKLLLIILFGYLVYKIGKNAAKLMLADFFKVEKIDKPEDLIQCAACERFISDDIAIKHKKLNFCSQECVDAYKQSE